MQPSWLPAELMPALVGTTVEQGVVHGNPDLISTVLRRWDLDAHVGVARREVDRDKETLFGELCAPPCVVVEDSDTYLWLGRDAGAFTVGVRHSHNSHAMLETDLVTHL